jgi:hypothetical protein
MWRLEIENLEVGAGDINGYRRWRLWWGNLEIGNTGVGKCELENVGVVM